MRPTVLITLMISLFFLVDSGRAQKGNDPAVIAGHDTAVIAEAKAAFFLSSQYPDSALALADKELTIARQTGNQRLAAAAYSTRGWSWLHKGNYDSIFPDLERSGRLYHQLHDTLDEMHVYVNMGMAYSQHSEFAKSARYLIMADSLAQAANDQRTKAEVKRQMGILYREQKQYVKAIPYFRESMAMYRALADTALFFGAASSLSAVYMNMSQPDSSLALLQECLPLAGALDGYEKGMMLEHFGDAYFGQRRYGRAMDSYDSAYRLFLNNHNRADMAYEAMNLGKTLIRLKDYRQAENYLLLSYRVNDSLNLLNYKHDVAQQFSDLFEATGDWRKAYHWLSIADSIQDSLDLWTMNQKTAQLQAQYEADKKEKEISLLKEERELNLAIVQRQKVFQRGAIVVVILLILIGLLIIGRYRAVNRARRLIEMEKMRNRIARDLHDDMGSALSSIHIISRVGQGNGGEAAMPGRGPRTGEAASTGGGPRTGEPASTGEASRMTERLQKIHEHSGLILENMSDIVWTINPANDSLEKVIFKMREFAADIFDPLNIGYVFNQEGGLPGTKLGLQTRRDMYLVFKEAVNNAAKYSCCSKVEITVAVLDGQVEIRISDNGVGFDREAVKCGNGLKNMEERAGQIHGQLTITSVPGSGTTVILSVRSHD